MDTLPKYTLGTWVIAVVNMAHVGAIFLALLFLIFGLALIFWFPLIGKILFALSLWIVAVQVVSRVKFVAAQKKGEPVLAVNSVEFNNEGAKHIDVLMPEMIEVMRDVCRRAGFRGIYVGISDFGRHWFDEHFPQGDVPDPIIKVHHSDLGFTYYFDAFNLKRGGILGKRYEYMKKRSLVARTYAVVFGLLERLKGNSAKAKAFFDSAINVNNCWEVPLTRGDGQHHRLDGDA